MFFMLKADEEEMVVGFEGEEGRHEGLRLTANPA